MIDVRIKINIATRVAALEKLQAIVGAIGDDPDLEVTWSEWKEAHQEAKAKAPPHKRASPQKATYRSPHPIVNGLAFGSISYVMLEHLAKIDHPVDHKVLGKVIASTGHYRPDSASPSLSILVKKGWVTQHPSAGMRANVFRITELGRTRVKESAEVANKGSA